MVVIIRARLRLAKAGNLNSDQVKKHSVKSLQLLAPLLDVTDQHLEKKRTTLETGRERAPVLSVFIDNVRHQLA